MLSGEKKGKQPSDTNQFGKSYFTHSLEKALKKIPQVLSLKRLNFQIFYNGHINYRQGVHIFLTTYSLK